MDPDACLENIRDAKRDDDKEEVKYLRKELRKWVKKGGYEPSDPNWRDA